MHGNAIQWLPVICQGMDGGGSSDTSASVSCWRPRNDSRTSYASIPQRPSTSRDASSRLTVRKFIRSGALLFIGLYARRSVAQATTNPQVDASVLPRGVGDIRALSAWTRYDELFGTAPGLTGFSRNIAYSLNTDSLTSSRAPQLALAEQTIRT